MRTNNPCNCKINNKHQSPIDWSRVYVYGIRYYIYHVRTKNVTYRDSSARARKLLTRWIEHCSLPVSVSPRARSVYNFMEICPLNRAKFRIRLHDICQVAVRRYKMYSRPSQYRPSNTAAHFKSQIGFWKVILPPNTAVSEPVFRQSQERLFWEGRLYKY